MSLIFFMMEAVLDNGFPFASASVPPTNASLVGERKNFLYGLRSEYRLPGPGNFQAMTDVALSLQLGQRLEIVVRDPKILRFYKWKKKEKRGRVSLWQEIATDDVQRRASILQCHRVRFGAPRIRWFGRHPCSRETACCGWRILKISTYREEREKIAADILDKNSRKGLGLMPSKGGSYPSRAPWAVFR